MMRSGSFISFLVGMVALVACTKDRPVPETPFVPVKPAEVGWHTLIINEFLATGNQFINEFGDPADWIEIYNPSWETVELDGVNWYITDDAEKTQGKFRLPAVSIAPRSYLLVWADNQHNNPLASDIHANFALSSAGEQLGLFFNEEGSWIAVDRYDYGQQQANISEGRSPDGSPNWVFFSTPTPGAPNL